MNGISYPLFGAFYAFAVPLDEAAQKCGPFASEWHAWVNDRKI